MNRARNIDVTLKRRRFHKLRGIPKWRVELHIRPGVTQSAEANTVKATWDAAVAGAELFDVAKVSPICPWDDNGKLI